MITATPSHPVSYFEGLICAAVYKRYYDWAVQNAFKSPVKYSRQVLGKQDFVKTYAYRNWIWETPTWRFYASRHGMTLELIAGSDFDWAAWNSGGRKQAEATINNFLDNWEAKEREITP